MGRVYPHQTKVWELRELPHSENGFSVI